MTATRRSRGRAGPGSERRSRRTPRPRRRGCPPAGASRQVVGDALQAQGHRLHPRREAYCGTRLGPARRERAVLINTELERVLDERGERPEVAPNFFGRPLLEELLLRREVRRLPGGPDVGMDGRGEEAAVQLRLGDEVALYGAVEQFRRREAPRHVEVDVADPSDELLPRDCPGADRPARARELRVDGRDAPARRRAWARKSIWRS